MKKCQSSDDRAVSKLQLIRKDKQLITVELISLSTTNPTEKIKSIKTTGLDITINKCVG